MPDVEYIHDPVQFEIDNDLRLIAIPPKGVVLGVLNDKNTNRVNFKMPLYYNGFDMSQFTVRINFVNAFGEPNFYEVDDLTIDGDYLLFTWLVDISATNYVGDVQFIVRMIRSSSGTITNQYSTTIGKCRVLEGLEVDNAIPPEEIEDILQKAIDSIHDHAAEEMTKISELLTNAITYEGAYTDSIDSLHDGIGLYTVNGTAPDGSPASGCPASGYGLLLVLTESVVLPRYKNITQMWLSIAPNTESDYDSFYGDIYIRKWISASAVQKWTDWVKIAGTISDSIISPRTGWSSRHIDGLFNPIRIKLNGIEEGATKTVIDTALSDTSTNPVQNKVIKKAIDETYEDFEWFETTFNDAYLPLISEAARRFLDTADIDAGTNDANLIVQNGIYAVNNDTSNVPVMRKRKIILTGTENWTETDGRYTMSGLTVLSLQVETDADCSEDLRAYSQNNTIIFDVQRTYATVDLFKQYLAEQLSRNNPVSVIYATTTASDKIGGLRVYDLTPTVTAAHTVQQIYTHLQTGMSYKRINTGTTYGLWEKVLDIYDLNKKRPAFLS